MAMDMLRSCYKSKMRLYRDSDVITPGAWHWCPKGAKVLPFPHLFGSRQWDEDLGGPSPPIGEQRPRGKWFRGDPHPLVVGDHPCGGRDRWEHGGLIAELGTPVFLPDGLPECCTRKRIVGGGDGEEADSVQFLGHVQTAQGGEGEDGEGVTIPTGLSVGVGGDGDDGTGQQVANATQRAAGGEGDSGLAVQLAADAVLGMGGESDAGTGVQFVAGIQTGGGGDAGDGAGVQSQEVGQLALGGDVEGGLVPQFTGHMVEALGGDVEGGVGIQFVSGVEPMLGGDADAGDAGQWSGEAQFGDGGDQDTGFAAQLSDTPQTAEGGDADDGLAEQVLDTPQTAEGGDADDGLAEQVLDTPQDGDGGDADGGEASQVVAYNYAIFTEEYTSGTHGGGSAAGGWTARTLNTERYDPDGLGVLSSGHVVLAAGTYRFRARSAALGGNECRTGLYNLTASAWLEDKGESAYSNSGSAYATAYSECVGTFTVAASQSLQVQTYTATNRATNGLGTASSIASVNECYATLEVWKIS